MHEALTAIIRDFHRRGWAPATSANYSFRNNAESTITISRSGVDKGEFSVNDWMVTDMTGKPLPPFEGVKPSAETLLHTAIYNLFPHIEVVLHTHSVVNTVFSLRHAQQDAVPFQGYELLKAISGVHSHQNIVHLPLFPNSQDMRQLQAEVCERLQVNGDAYAFLLCGHGLYAWGATLAEAKRHVEAWEFLMECELKLRT